MGLTDRRKTAKNLVDSRKNWKILTVNREFAPRPWVERSRVCFYFFTKIIYILTVDISMREIILEVEYCIKYDLLNVKIF